jgi:hypothetical protein
MSQSTTSLDTVYTPHASLAALAAQLKALGIFEAIRTGVHIAQKTVKDSPQDKLIDILMTLLCGAQSLVQINTLLRVSTSLTAQHWARTLLRTIGRATNLGCGDCRECGANATDSYHPQALAQSGRLPQQT